MVFGTIKKIVRKNNMSNDMLGSLIFLGYILIGLVIFLCVFLYSYLKRIRDTKSVPEDLEFMSNLNPFQDSFGIFLVSTLWIISIPCYFVYIIVKYIYNIFENILINKLGPWYLKRISTPEIKNVPIENPDYRSSAVKKEAM